MKDGHGVALAAERLMTPTAMIAVGVYLEPAAKAGFFVARLERALAASLVSLLVMAGIKSPPDLPADW